MNLFSVWYRQVCRSAASQLGGQKLPVIPAGVAAGYHRCFWQPSWQGGGCGAEGVSCSFRSRGRPEVYFVQQLIRSSQLLWFRGGTDGGPSHPPSHPSLNPVLWFRPKILGSVCSVCRNHFFPPGPVGLVSFPGGVPRRSVGARVLGAHGRTQMNIFLFLPPCPAQLLHQGGGG
jgi:hypothetical protein